MCRKAASQYGQTLIRQAIFDRSRTINDPRWCLEASDIIDPNKPQGFYYPGFYAPGCSMSTWLRFVGGKNINCNVFIAFCQNLELNRKEIYEINDLLDIYRPYNPSYEVILEGEDKYYQEILKPGSLLRIIGTKQSGKKRLLRRLLNRIVNNDYQLLVFDFQTELDSTVFNSLETFSKSFIYTIQELLELSENINDYWDNQRSCNRNITVYFQKCVLPTIDRPLVLVLESLDLVFEHKEVANDFCNLLRGWHNQAQRDENWQKIRIIIVHSTDSYALFDINSSPLANVGMTITVDGWTEQQITYLATQYNLNLTEEQIDKFISLVGGHPFLINHAFKSIKNNDIPFEQLLSKAGTEEGIYSNYLRRIREILEEKQALKEAFKQVVLADYPVLIDRGELFKLKSLGLINVVDDFAIPSCRLYQEFFRKYFTEGE